MGKLWSCGTSTFLKIASEILNDNDFFSDNKGQLSQLFTQLTELATGFPDSKPSKKDVGENVGE